jgi:hypothetical protein
MKGKAMHANKHSTSYRRELDPTSTKKAIHDLFARPFDSEALEGVSLDAREVAKFVAETTRVLRLAAMAGGLRGITYMIEMTFYEAFAQSRQPSQSLELRGLVRDLNCVSN